MILSRKSNIQLQTNMVLLYAWEIPWTEETGGLQSMGSQRVRYDLVTKQQHECIRVCVCVFTNKPIWVDSVNA